MPRAMPKTPEPDVRRVRNALLGFYDAHRRTLPWRDDPRPYRVWISEVMLQQTRVDAVLPYYRAWMERFPNVRALAEASLDDVLKAWEGLGYYARARNLHRAALVLRDRMGGRLPIRAAELRKLPGFGEYTSGAVASIAFGEVVPAVDGNARRVLARLFDEAEPAPGWLRACAAAVIDPGRPGDFNQALMELGATVCTPRGPECVRCPLTAECMALRRGTVAERPKPRPRAAVPDVEIAVAALVRRGAHGRAELLLVRRPPEGLLGGLWELPGCEMEGEEAAEPVASRAAAVHGLATTGAAKSLPVVEHAFSHFRGIYKPFLWEIRSAEADPAASGGRSRARSSAQNRARSRARSPGSDRAWVDVDGLAALALPRAQRRIAESVLARTSSGRCPTSARCGGGRPTPRGGP